MESSSANYFDSAATSFPKSPGVARRMLEALGHGGSYGRGAYPGSVEATRTVEHARKAVAALIGAKDAKQVSFCSGATEALNTVLLGFPYRHKRVAITPLEHNSVTRCLHYLRETKGVQSVVLPALPSGELAVDELPQSMGEALDLVVVNWVSNVSGVVQPVGRLSSFFPNVPILVDASQGMGHIPMDVGKWRVEWAAFSAHKGLAGPTGVGILYGAGRVELTPHNFGGTGIDSLSPTMPPTGPGRYEAGTPNLLGISGLLGALEEPIPPRHTWENFCELLAEVRLSVSARLIAPPDAHRGIELFTLIPHSGDVAGLALRLSDDYGIATRAGLHCAPSAHRFYGAYPAGGVRVSLSPAHTVADLEFLLKALQACSN